MSADREAAVEGLGQRLKHARFSRGWTQAELQQQTGVSKSFISELETGKSIPRADILVRLASALDVSLDWLVLGREPEQEKVPRTVAEVLEAADLASADPDKTDAIDWLGQAIHLLAERVQALEKKPPRPSTPAERCDHDWITKDDPILSGHKICSKCDTINPVGPVTTERPTQGDEP